MAIVGPEHLLETSKLPARPEGWTVRVITSPAELEHDQGMWTELGRQAAEPNSFYEPWFFLPAVRAFAEPAAPWRIIVLEQTVKNKTHWAGFFPFQVAGARWQPMGRQLKLWQHDNCFLTTPLIRAGQEHDVLHQLLAHLKNDRSFPSLMHWPLATSGGPIGQALIDIVRRETLSVHAIEIYNRALLRPWEGPDSVEACEEYLLRSLGGHHLREVRRQRRRLVEAGDLEFRSLQNRAQLGVWTDWFLKLEATGWKGRVGTAFDCQPATREFFRDIIEGGFDSGAIQMFGLFRRGEPLAMKFNLLSGSGGFSFKITYQEEFAKLSPGVQLEIDHLRHFQTSGQKWMDSCAIADHSMINRLWADRRTVQNLLISTGRWSSDLRLASLPMGRSIVHTIRRLARAAMQFVLHSEGPLPDDHTKLKSTH